MSVKGIQQGEYSIVIRDEQGREIRRVQRVSKKRFPLLGEALRIDDKFYRVIDVQHFDDEPEGYRQFVYTDLVVIAKEVMDNDSAPTDPHDNGDPSGTDPDRKGAGRGTKLAVIPFHPVTLEASSPLLAFHWLVALAVTVGYHEQAHLLESLKVESWQLHWAGRGWVVEQLTDGLSPTELRALSRAAGREEALASNFLQAALAIVPVEKSNVVDLSAYRRAGDRS